METEIKQQIRTFLAKYFKNYDLKDDEDIFSLGFVNSLFAMQLVMFIESQFGAKLDNSELQLDNFRTIQVMTDLVMQKQASVS